MGQFYFCQAFNFVLQEIVLFCCTCTVVEFTHAILCTGAEGKEAMVGKFCSGGQTENKILGYLLVAESIVIMWNAVTSWENMELSGQGMKVTVFHLNSK